MACFAISVALIICNIQLDDGFVFEKVKIGKLTHPHMNYTWIEVLLLAKLGGPQTHIQIDLGFGDIVESIDYPMDLTSTSKGPLFESTIHVRSYPKDFIFAENLRLKFDFDFIDILQPLWRDYRRDLSSSQTPITLPESIQEVISSINSWLTQNMNLCSSHEKNPER